MTNAHVVAGLSSRLAAPKLTVSTMDGRTFEAKVRAVDEVADLAVVQVRTPAPLSSPM